MEVVRQLSRHAAISNITINDWFEIYLISNSISHTWIIFPRSKTSLPTKPVFESILTKALCQYILNLMSKKNPSYVCHDMNIFCPASFVKFPWRFWTEISQYWKDLKKTLQIHENLGSLTDLSGANVGFHSNSRDWICWVFMMWTAFSIFIKNSINAIPKY